MKKLLLILAVTIALAAPVVVLAARFDWSLGRPVLTDDDDNTTNGVRYDWVLGRPTIVWDEPTAAAAAGTPDLTIKSNALQIKSGTLQIK